MCTAAPSGVAPPEPGITSAAAGPHGPHEHEPDPVLDGRQGDTPAPTGAAVGEMRVEDFDEDDEDDDEWWAAAAREWDEEDDEMARQRFRTLSFALVDAAMQPVLQLIGFYPLQFLAVKAVLAGPPGRALVWPGGLALLCSLTPAGLYRGFLPLALSTALGGLAAKAPSMLLHARTGQQPAPTARVVAGAVGRALAVVPQLVLEKAWVRMLCTRDAGVLGSVRGAALGAPALSLSGGVWGLPYWLALSRAFILPLYGKLLPHGRMPAQLMARLLPADHPLAERRGLRESLAATPRHLRLLVPLVGLPLPGLDVRTFGQGFGGSLGASIGAHGTTLARLASCVPGGLAVGAAPWYAARALYRRARRSLLRQGFESTDSRLARRLQHATAHAARLRGRVGTRSLLARLAAPAPPPLDRRPTVELAARAAEGLEPKRERLLARIAAHLQACMAAQPPEMAAGGARLIVRRDNIAASTRYVAHVPALALLAGKVRICFVGEPAQDDGGVFREYMSLLAAALGGASSLLEPAPDGGLLPAAGQAARERRALAATRELTVSVSKPGAGTRLGIALAICEPVREPRIQGLPVGFPAAASGLLQRGDAVLQVNGCVVPHCRSSRQAIELFRAAGKDVTLGLRRYAEPLNPAWREELFAVGRLLAVSIIAECPLDVRLSRCLYKLLLHETITAADVARIDPLFAQHRVDAVLRPGGVAAVEDALCSELMFTGVPREGREMSGRADEGDPLVEGGRQRRVTEANKHEYIKLLVEHFLIGFCREELAVLVEGFHDLIPPHVLREPCARGGGAARRLSALELELIVAGVSTIDVDDWREHSAWRVAGRMAASAERQLREWFWAVVREMEGDQRARLLSFACGSGRLPAAGFRALRPTFTVKVMAAVEPENLPTAHTCVNTLCLPNYGSKEEVQQRVLRAIEEDVGFGFA